MEMMIKELGEIITGNTPSKNIEKFWESDDICFVKPDIISDNGVNVISESNEYISEEARKKTKIVTKNTIFVTCIGSIGKIGIASDGEFAFNQQINAIIPNAKVNPRYLAYNLLFNRPRLVAIANAPVVPIINKSRFGEFSVKTEMDTDKQLEIVNILDKLSNIIEQRKQELLVLDDLIKARFVEMFGDPVSNQHGYEKVCLSELADIKIGPFGSLLHKEDYIKGGHPLLNPSHIIDGKVAPDNELSISDEKYKELSAYQLHVGDVVMGRRGEMGRCAVVLDEGYICGTGSLMIRTKGDVTADYIQKVISFPSFKKTIEDMAVGQTMPNLNVPIVSSFQVIKPPIEVQNRYYAFVEQVDK